MGLDECPKSKRKCRLPSQEFAYRLLQSLRQQEWIVGTFLELHNDLISVGNDDVSRCFDKVLEYVARFGRA